MYTIAVAPVAGVMEWDTGHHAEGSLIEEVAESQPTYRTEQECWDAAARSRRGQLGVTITCENVEPGVWVIWPPPYSIRR